MNPPGDAALRFLVSLAVGSLLGIFYAFLRPLRPKHTVLSDSIFLTAAAYGWMWLSFRVCRGDLRTVWLLGMILGGVAAETTLGRLLLPIFRSMWALLGKIWQFLLLPGKKFLHFAKILIASGEKWVTIRWSNRRQKPGKNRGGAHGRTERILKPDQVRLPAQQQHHQGDRDRGHLVEYDHFDRLAAFHHGTGKPDGGSAE